MDEVIEITEVDAELLVDADIIAELSEEDIIYSDATDIYTFGVTSVNEATGDVTITGSNGLNVTGTNISLEDWLVLDCGTSTTGI